MPHAEDCFRFVYQGASMQRLDKAVCAELGAQGAHGRWTRSQVKHWVEGGRVSVDGCVETKAGFAIKGGSVIEVSIPPLATDLAPCEMPLDIIFEDAHVIVINKAPGVVMHPGAGNPDQTLANALVAHFTKAGGNPFDGIRPGIVHRIDKDTTGLVVVAKTIEAHAALAAQFASREAGRRYHALVLSTPRGKRLVDRTDSGTIEGNIGRHPSERQRFAVVEAAQGKAAMTHWRVLERMPYASLLEVKIATGRTHQIRVHMSHAGSPVIGDRTYGDFSALPAPLKAAATSFGRQALHAAALEFTHPASGQRVEFRCEAPQDMQDLIARFRRPA